MPQKVEASILNSVKNTVSTSVFTNNEPDVKLSKLLRTLLIISFLVYGVNSIFFVLNIVRGYYQFTSLSTIPSLISLFSLLIYIGIWFKKKIAIYLFLFFNLVSIIISVPVGYVVSSVNNPTGGMTYFILGILLELFFFGLWIFALKRDWSKFH